MPQILNPSDIRFLREPDAPAINPQRREALYSVQYFNDAGQRARDIYLLRSEGTKQHITNTGTAHHPEWAQDGIHFAYANGPDANGNSQLYIADSKGTIINTYTVTGDITALSWDPDGSRIAVEYLESPEPEQQGVKEVTELRFNFNSRGYIGRQRWTVGILSLQTGQWTRIGKEGFHHFSPSWSPDGKEIAVVTNHSDEWDLEWVWDIYVVHLEHMKWEKVTDSSGIAMYPVWSPTERKIAFLYNHSPQTGSTSDYHLCEASFEKSWSFSCLSHSLDRGAALIHEPPEPGGGKPLYVDGGKRILWVMNDGGCHKLCKIDRLGNTEVVGEDFGWPSQTQAGDCFAALHFQADSPAHVVIAETESNEIILDEDENPWLADYEVCSKPELLTFRSTHSEVEAWLWSTGELTEPRPLLIHFHGGPHGAFGPYFSITQQVLSSHGYLVAALNYRGSAGYGQEFADIVHANWGPSEGEDGIRLIDVLGEKGLADPNRVGVFGPSYGGFMTSWMMTHYPDRISAGVAISTVSSLLTSALGIDHWESIATDQGGKPWEIPGYYHDHSPIMFANRIVAPLLLLHGEEDMTCPLIEAEMMFTALRMQRKPVKLVRYEDESHSFHRAGRLGTMADAHQRMIEWFGRYI